jgi:hypothetical protein
MIPEPNLILGRGAMSDPDLDRAFARLEIQQGESEGSSMRALIPAEILSSAPSSMAELLASALAEYEEIEAVVANLKEHEGSETGEGTVIEDAVAVVSDAELGDPEALVRALEPLQSKTAQIEFLYARAKYGLDRLDIYRLSRMSAAELLEAIRQQNNKRSIQSVVQFLHALNCAAETFEALELPRHHIRDYLRHLYMMPDWQEMERLVEVLEVAAAGLPEAAPTAG